MCDHTGRRDGNRRNKCDGGVSETERALFYHFKLAWTQKTAGRSLIPFFSLRPRITCHPQSHRPSHRKTLITGCHYVWLHLSLRNLETLFTQPKNTSIRRESRVNRVNVEWLLPPNGTRNWHVFFFFLRFRDCYKDECRSIACGGKKKKSGGCNDVRWSRKKKASGRSNRGDVLEDFRKDVVMIITRAALRFYHLQAKGCEHLVYFTHFIHVYTLQFQESTVCVILMQLFVRAVDQPGHKTQTFLRRRCSISFFFLSPPINNFKT